MPQELYKMKNLKLNSACGRQGSASQKILNQVQDDKKICYLETRLEVWKEKKNCYEREK